MVGDIPDQLKRVSSGIFSQTKGILVMPKVALLLVPVSVVRSIQPKRKLSEKAKNGSEVLKAVVAARLRQSKQDL